jgi:hypothetical protein
MLFALRKEQQHSQKHEFFVIMVLLMLLRVFKPANLTVYIYFLSFCSFCLLIWESFCTFEGTLPYRSLPTHSTTHLLTHLNTHSLNPLSLLLVSFCHSAREVLQTLIRYYVLMKKLRRVGAQPRYHLGRKEMPLVIVVSRNVARQNKFISQLT